MTDPTLLATRYGTSRRRDRVVVASLAAGLLALFGVWAFWSNATDRTAGIESVAFRSEMSGSTATVTWNVTAPAWTAVTCALRTVGPDMATNGWLVVTLPPVGDATTTHTRTIRSVGKAVGVDVYSCWRTKP